MKHIVTRQSDYLIGFGPLCADAARAAARKARNHTKQRPARARMDFKAATV